MDWNLKRCGQIRSRMCNKITRSLMQTVDTFLGHLGLDVVQTATWPTVLFLSFFHFDVLLFGNPVSNRNWSPTQRLQAGFLLMENGIRFRACSANDALLKGQEDEEGQKKYEEEGWLSFVSSICQHHQTSVMFTVAATVYCWQHKCCTRVCVCLKDLRSSPFRL